MNITHEQYTTAELVNTRANNLAVRWTKSLSNYYSWASNVKINWDNNKIQFNAELSTSGIGLQCSIDIKYLFDDTNLEQDAKLWYEKCEQERKDRYNRISYLEQTKDVIEYKQLKETFDIINFSPLRANLLRY